MKFVKENMTVLICAVVALLLVVGAFVYPIPGMVTALKADMTEDLGKEKVVQQYMNTPLQLLLRDHNLLDVVVQVRRDGHAVRVPFLADFLHEAADDDIGNLIEDSSRGSIWRARMRCVAVVRRARSSIRWPPTQRRWLRLNTSGMRFRNVRETLASVK